MPVETTKIKIGAAGTLLSQDGIRTLGQPRRDVLDDADAREVVALCESRRRPNHAVRYWRRDHREG